MPCSYLLDSFRAGVLGNRASGVRNSRKPNLCHHSFLEALYIGIILCGADWGYARMHECTNNFPVYRVLGKLKVWEGLVRLTVGAQVCYPRMARCRLVKGMQQPGLGR